VQYIDIRSSEAAAHISTRYDCWAIRTAYLAGKNWMFGNDMADFWRLNIYREYLGLSICDLAFHADDIVGIRLNLYAIF
jgi:hypothetical protein